MLTVNFKLKEQIKALTQKFYLDLSISTII